MQALPAGAAPRKTRRTGRPRASGFLSAGESEVTTTPRQVRNLITPLALVVAGALVASPADAIVQTGTVTAGSGDEVTLVIEKIGPNAQPKRCPNCRRARRLLRGVPRVSEWHRR